MMGDVPTDLPQTADKFVRGTQSGQIGRSIDAADVQTTRQQHGERAARRPALLVYTVHCHLQLHRLPNNIFGKDD